MTATPILLVAIIAGSIGGILLAVEIGYRFGLRRWAANPLHSANLASTVEATVFGLMGVLVGFSIYGAGARFDARRNLIAQEANAIGTAYLRLDMLPSEAQPELREEFRQYLRSRIATFHKVPDWKAVEDEIAHSTALQRAIWGRAVNAAMSSGPAVQTLVLGSLNEMIDITTTRSVTLILHPPMALFAMLGVTMIASSAMMGYTSAASGIREWAAVITFAVVLGTAVWVVVDYEYPRIGLIREDPVDQVLVRTLEQMN